MFRKKASVRYLYTPLLIIFGLVYLTGMLFSLALLLGIGV